MENIPSLKYITNNLVVRVAVDTARQKLIIVRLDSGKIYKLNQCGEFLYYFDTKEQEGFDVVVDIVSNDG